VGSQAQCDSRAEFGFGDGPDRAFRCSVDTARSTRQGLRLLTGPKVRNTLWPGATPAPSESWRGATMTSGAAAMTVMRSPQRSSTV
jgi:hypothetical protein